MGVSEQLYSVNSVCQHRSHTAMLMSSKITKPNSTIWSMLFQADSIYAFDIDVKITRNFNLIPRGGVYHVGTMTNPRPTGVLRSVYIKIHNDVIKWNHLSHYWPFVRRIHQSPVNSTHKGRWHGALMFSLICAGMNVWVSNREASDLKRQRAHYDVTLKK